LGRLSDSLKRFAIAAAVACVGLFVQPAQAHDYWLSPAVVVSRGPVTVPVSLFVGEGLVPEEEKAHQATRAVLLQHWFAGGSEDLLPRAVEGAKPAFSFSAKAPGGHLIVLERNAAHIEMAAPKFEAYLLEEGLASIVQERKRRGETDKPARERYTRYLKALVQVGDQRDEAYRAGPKQALTIDPGENPVFIASGGTLEVVVLFRGEPLAGATLEALSRDGERVTKQVLVTDANGVGHVALEGAGVRLLRMVHMIHCDDCKGADWESFWASYLFGTKPADGGELTLPALAAAVSKPPTSDAGTVPPKSGGCGCEVARDTSSASRWALCVAFVALVLLRRK